MKSSMQYTKVYLCVCFFSVFQSLFFIGFQYWFNLVSRDCKFECFTQQRNQNKADLSLCLCLLHGGFLLKKQELGLFIIFIYFLKIQAVFYCNSNISTSRQRTIRPVYTHPTHHKKTQLCTSTFFLIPWTLELANIVCKFSVYHSINKKDDYERISNTQI